MIVFKTEAYTIEQSACPIPGYLILRPLIPVRSLPELSPAALASLGPLLALATQVIERLFRPERVYLARFGEEVEAVHFHLLPRTQRMGELYLQHHPQDSAINGVQLFDWVRALASRSPDLFGMTSLTVPDLRDAFQSDNINCK